MAPAWLIEARRYIGVREIKGPQHEPRILAWWKAIKRAGIKDDETPWCAAFVGGCLEAVGLMSSRFESAASYLTWGQPIAWPHLGAIVVLPRAGGNHVAFLAGMDRVGNFLLLGGNQGDAVSVSAFSPYRMASAVYRWPTAVPVPAQEPLPILAQAAASRSEA